MKVILMELGKTSQYGNLARQQFKVSEEFNHEWHE
jgi:hypothetical protein